MPFIDYHRYVFAGMMLLLAIPTLGGLGDVGFFFAGTCSVILFVLVLDGLLRTFWPAPETWRWSITFGLGLFVATGAVLVALNLKGKMLLYLLAVIVVPIAIHHLANVVEAKYPNLASNTSDRIERAFDHLGTMLIVLAVLAVLWFGVRPLFDAILPTPGTSASVFLSVVAGVWFVIAAHRSH